jgi:hypothetical protein
LLTCLQHAQNHTNSRLLQLPAEIRLQIYSYCIYPALRRIKIVQAATPLRFEETALIPSIFRASRQLRAEALSYLCSNKALQIYGLDTANAFFKTIGSDAIGDVRSLSIAQVIVPCDPLPPKQNDLLLHFLGQATSLQYLKLEIGFLEHDGDSNVDTVYETEKDMVLFEKISEFVKEREGLDFRWVAGVANSQLCRLPGFERSVERVGNVLGEEYKDMLMPMMNLW